MKKFILSSGFGSLFWPSSPVSISSLVLLSLWCRPWECFFCVAASQPLKRTMLTSLPNDALSVIGYSSIFCLRIWIPWCFPMLWASWLKNSNTEENILCLSVNPLQWWVDFLSSFISVVYRSFLFLIKSWMYEQFFKCWSLVLVVWYSYVFFIFLNKKFSLLRLVMFSQRTNSSQSYNIKKIMSICITSSYLRLFFIPYKNNQVRNDGWWCVTCRHFSFTQ